MSFVVDPNTTPGEPPSWPQRCCPRIGWKHLTTVIFFVDTIILICELIVGSVTYGCAFAPKNSMGGPTTFCLYCMGAKWEPDIHAGAVWRLITPIFLHTGILHLALNMFMLCRFGYVLEARWGWWKFGLVYLLSGISASLWSAVIAYATVSVGASGAIMGIMGADITYIIYNWHEIPQVKIEAINIGITLLFNFLIGGLSPDVDNYAHLGGLISGLALGVWFVPHPEKRDQERVIRIIAGVVFCGLFLLFVLLLFVGNPGGKEWQSDGRYLRGCGEKQECV